LKKRYEQLVAAHSNAVPELAAGLKALPDGAQCFAHTQALWRFLANEQVTPQVLITPVLAAARVSVREACEEYALVAHDWSRLNYGRHDSKRDRVQMTHARDVGYELQSSLLMTDRAGEPVGAVAQNLVTAQGVWSTYQAGCQPRLPHLEELSGRMQWLQEQALGKPLVHIVDREADSVGHLRHWSAQQWRWLIRAKAGARVHYGGQSQSLAQVGEGLSYALARTFDYQGQSVRQFIAEGVVSITRAARPKRTGTHGERSAPIHGEALSVRLVVSRIEDAAGKTIATWYLLSNLPESVPAERLALWYYWRWRIESYFKLLKQAGHQLESWEQETGLAILKRVLIASHACALSWRLLRSADAQAQHTAAFLVRLSGRQMKRTRPSTAPALLEGLYQLFTMLEVLEHYSIDQLKSFARTAFPQYTRAWR
jgi:hypothetical protein